MKYYLTISILALYSISYSQAFDIYNSKSKISIIATDHLEIGVKVSDIENCCDLITFEGNFTSIGKDSISFNFLSSKTNLQLSPLAKDLKLKYLNNHPNKTIAIKDIVYLTDYKSKKSKKTRENLILIGGLIMTGGAFTAINALFFADNNKKELLIASGAQMGIGFVLGLSAHKSPKSFIKKNDPWKFK